MGEYAGHPGTGRLAVRLGHYSHLLLSASILAVIALGVYPLSGPLMFTAPIALLVFVLMSWVLMRQHDRRLCELCMSAMPLNPSEVAAHYRARFWLAHSGMRPRFLVPYLALLIGSNFAMGFIGRIGWALVQSTMLYLIAAYSTHRRLQPWCPWCRGGGGDDDRDDVAPPPPPVDRRLFV
jgi:hypothetical protein